MFYHGRGLLLLLFLLFINVDLEAELRRHPKTIHS